MKYEVQITRIGYAFHNVEMEADSDKEAKYKADDLAGDILYSENHSDYQFDILSKSD